MNRLGDKRSRFQARLGGLDLTQAPDSSLKVIPAIHILKHLNKGSICQEGLMMGLSWKHTSVYLFVYVFSERLNREGKIQPEWRVLDCFIPHPLTTIPTPCQTADTVASCLKSLATIPSPPCVPSNCELTLS